MGSNDRRRLRVRSRALNAKLPGDVQTAAAELVVALANHDTHRHLEGVRAKARAVFDSESLSTVTAGEWREWARQAYSWLLVAAGAKTGSVHAALRGVVKRQRTPLKKFLDQSGDLVKAQAAWRAARKRNNRRFTHAVTRFTGYVR